MKFGDGVPEGGEGAANLSIAALAHGDLPFSAIVGEAHKGELAVAVG